MYEKVNEIFSKVKELSAKPEYKVDEIEVYASKGGSEEFRAKGGKSDHYSFAENMGFCVRVLKDGRIAQAYSEGLSADFAEKVLADAVEMLPLFPKDEHNLMPAAGRGNDESRLRKGLEELGARELKERAIDLEKKLYAFDKRVDSVIFSICEKSDGESVLINSAGAGIHSKACGAVIFCEISCSEGSKQKTSENMLKVFNKEELYNDGIIEDTVNHALDKLSAETAQSATKKVLLKKRAAVQLISSFKSLFSAKLVQKGVSAFAGKVNERVADEKLSLFDSPRMEEGLASRLFDAEGMPTQRRALIENGILKGLLHNSYTASKDGVQSTANASRPGYKGGLGISFNNLEIARGSKSLNELIETADDAVLVDSLMGLHAGLNKVSGDFSVQAGGYSIKGGKLGKALEPFTIAGNFFEMLQNIELIANDTDMRYSSSYVPSLLISELSVSGS